MDVLLDTVARRKLMIVKSKDRVFYLEFPADSDESELYGVAALFKEKLWETLEKKRLEEEKKCECKEVEAKAEEEVEE